MTLDKRVLVAVLITSSFSIAVRSQQSVPVMAHVSSVTEEPREEYSRSIWGVTTTTDYPRMIYKVDSGNLTYMLESEDHRQVEVGQDYEVKKVTRKEMILLVPRKNKRPAEAYFHIKSVSPKEDRK